MTQPDSHQQPDSLRSRIPPALGLWVAGLGALIALTIWLTQPSFGVGGLAGLGMMLLGFIVWGALAPRQVNALIKGRWVRFGGVAVLVVILFAVMWVALYAVTKQASIRADFSATDLYSLTTENETLVTALALDPTMPDVRVLAFLGVAQAGTRDRIQVLLDGYVNASAGRITYEFIDPDREPVRTNQFNAQAGQALVVPLQADGTLNEASARRLDSINQQSLSDALVALSATGDYRAYFLAVDDSLDINDPSAIGVAVLAQQLRNRFNWRVEMVSLFDLDRGVLGDGTPFLDENADGEVLVIAGGSFALNPEQLAPLQRYIESGGDLVIFAGVNVQGGQALATDNALNTLLDGRFAIRINNDLVIDPYNAVQSLFVTRANRWGDADIVTFYTPDDHIDFIAPHSLSADELRTNVIVTPIIYTSDTAYAKASFDFSRNLSDTDLAVSGDDALGVQLLGAHAENLQTGNRGAFFASESLVYNEYEADQSAGTRNLLLARDAIFWTAGYDSQVLSLPTTQLGTRPEDTPLNASLQQLNGIQFAAVFALPGVVLLMGIMVWWRNRRL